MSFILKFYEKNMFLLKKKNNFLYEFLKKLLLIYVTKNKIWFGIY